MNIGAGRVVMQDLPRLNAAVKDGSLAAHPDLIALAAKLRASGGTAHVMGLLSPGGVHAHQDHFLAVITAVRRRHPERHHREGRVRESDPTLSWGWGLAPRALLDHPRLRDGRARVEPDHSEDDPEVAVVGVVDLIARDRDEGGRASYFTRQK